MLAADARDGVKHSGRVIVTRMLSMHRTQLHFFQSINILASLSCHRETWKIEPRMNANERRCSGVEPYVPGTIGCALTVANSLGCGFLEKIYENARAYELRQAGLTLHRQAGVAVRYHGIDASGRMSLHSAKR